MRIAIANDLRMAQEILKSAVARIPGASVAWLASDGAEACARCASDRPDLILMDMVMPVMDGAKATARIMRDSPCPILVVTSTIEGNLDLVYDALSAGAIDAVQTPSAAALSSPGGLDALLRRIALVRSLHAPGHAHTAAAAGHAALPPETPCPAASVHDARGRGGGSAASATCSRSAHPPEDLRRSRQCSAQSRAAPFLRRSSCSTSTATSRQDWRSGLRA
jgi:two-component system response regulator WspF